MKKIIGSILGICILLIQQGCISSSPQLLSSSPSVMGKLTLSSVWKPNGLIPTRYTCDGNEEFPPLTVIGIPEGTISLALIIDDPDAPIGMRNHYLASNIPVEKTKEINAFKPSRIVGQNSWKRNDWGGPCPPDREHRYFFKLYALNTNLDLKEGFSKKDLEQAMQGHIIQQAELVGRYNRPSNN